MGDVETKTKAFILQKYPFKESSFVIHCFSEHLGKTKFVLRGATKKQSRLANYQLGNIIELDISYGKQRSWLKTYQHSQVLEIIPKRYQQFCILSFLLEFIYKTDFPDENSGQIFSIYQKFYEAINLEKLFYFYFLKTFAELIQIIGFYPQLTACYFCKKQSYKKISNDFIFRKKKYIIAYKNAQIVCSDCSKKEEYLNSAHIKILSSFKDKEIQVIVEKIDFSILKESFYELFKSYSFYYSTHNLKSLPDLLASLGIERK